MKLTSAHDFLVTEVQDLYDAEHQITQAMPQLIEAVSSPQLKKDFESHLEETHGQIQRLEKICKELGIEPQGKTCVGMEGIIEEGIELLQENTPSPVLDAALISAAQKVEHYEICGYGTAAALAKQMRHEKVFDLLLQTLEEEKACDQKLTEIAENSINKQADTSQNGKYAM